MSALGGYLVGAIPSGVMVGRLRGVDPRRAGSGRIGTTNALRTLGPALAVTVFLLDVGKGAVAVLIGRWLAEAVGASSVVEWAGAAGGAAAAVGHVRSVFIGFGGGRGVATSAGAVAVMVPLALLIAVPAFALGVWATRYVSLGSLLAAVTGPLAAAVLFAAGAASPAAVVLAAACGLIVVLAHRDNIARLRAGTERRLGDA